MFNTTFELASWRWHALLYEPWTSWPAVSRCILNYRYPVTPVARWRQSIDICVFARAADIPPMASWPRPPMAPSPRRLVVPGPPIASGAHQTRVSVPDLCDAPRWSHRGGWPSTPQWSRGPLRSARTWGKAPSVRSWIASRHARPCSTWGRPPISYGGGGTSRTIGGTSAATRSANRTASGRSWSSTSRSQGATAPQWRNT